MVGVRGVGGGPKLLVEGTFGRIVDGQPAFGIDDAAFGLHQFRVEGKIPDAVGLHVDDEPEGGLGEPVLVNGDVAGGITVVAPAVVFHDDVELLGAIFLRAVEHHVLEEMRHTRRSWLFVA